MKKLTLLSFALVIGFNLFSQDIANSIRNYEPSKSDLISRGRNLLLDSYISGDLDKVKEAYLYLNTKLADENYAVFNAFEQVYLGALTENYTMSLKEILRLDSVSNTTSKQRIEPVLPANDQLSRKLSDNSFIYLPKMYKKINESSLSNEDKSLLTLVLNDIFDNAGHKSRQDENNPQQDTINKKATEFLTLFPNTKYEHFVRNSVRFVYKKSDWGFGMDFSIGYANAGFKSRDINDGFLFGFGWDFHYKKLAAYTRVNLVINTIKHDFYFTPSVVLPAGSSILNGGPELSFGYEAFDSKSFNLIPFAGIGAILVDPNQNEQNSNPIYKNLELASFSYHVGINCDIKFKPINGYNPYFSFNQSSYSSVRLRLMYIMPTSKMPELRSNLLLFSVGWGFNSYSKKRVL